MDDRALRRSRTLAAALEPVIGQVYFSPECHAAYTGLGFAPSPGLMGLVALPDGPAYFTSRGSLLGQVRPGVVAAAFGVFKPDIVSAGVTLGWSLTDAPTIFAERHAGAVAQLDRVLGAPDETVARASALLERAVTPLGIEGRPLFAGLRSWWDDPTDAWTRLFHLGDMLRECRGDAHVCAWSSVALDAVEIGLLNDIYMGMPLRSYVRTRGWNDEELEAGTERLHGRGWLEGDEFTDDGRDAREDIERHTDRQMTPALEALGDDFGELIGLLEPWGASLAKPARTWAARSTFGPFATTDVTVVRSGSADRVSASFVCRGHPNITATHDKTLEFTRDAEISRRATCVIGVSSAHDDRALVALRGRVEVVLECEGARDSFTATISPYFLGDSSLVFRRGSALRGRTIASDASKTAATLDRDLVERLRSSDHELHVTITAIKGVDETGALFVVSTPIGNDDDIGRRAIDVLERVDLVLAEDTRRLRDLGRRLGIDIARSTSYHDHNESERVEGVLQRLRTGARIALVSDAGTPLFSDPGYVVVSRAVAEGIPVCPVPGPSAALATLVASGLPIDRFVFGGFLPRRSASRRQAMQQLSAAGFAVVLYEAAPRLAETLADIAAVCPDWRVCLGREVTKIFEEFRYGSVAEMASEITGEKLLGECTLVVAPPAANDIEAPAATATDAQLDDLLRSLLAQGVPASTLAQALRVLPGIGRNQAYERVLALGRDLPSR